VKRVSLVGLVLAVTLGAVGTGCAKKSGAVSEDASATSSTAQASASAPPSVEVSAAPPEPKTPKELLEEHRRALAKLVDDEKYAEVCRGAPWFQPTICSWVAARAAGKGSERPDGELFRAYFGKEHWKHVYGTVIGDPKEGYGIEVSVSGYKNHCLLTTTDTKFTSRGRFDLWVQEQVKLEEVTLNSGNVAHWVGLVEMPLARMLMSLAKSGGGIEATATAKDIMAQIASYETYAEQKEELPPVPGAAPPVPASAPSVTAAPAAAPQAEATLPAAKVPPAQPPASPKSPAKRAACVSACVSKCADDSACERACVSKCPS
jgi:hypothetical protein